MRVCVFACMHIHIRTHTYTHREEDRQSDSDTKTQRPTRILLPHISSYFKLVMKEWPSYPTITLKQQSHLKKVLTYNKHVLDHSYSDLPDIPKDLPTTSFLLACLCEWSSIGSWIWSSESFPFHRWETLANRTSPPLNTVSQDCSK